MRNEVFYVWNSIPLNPEMSSSSKRLELNSLNIEDALAVAYPQLSFCGIHQAPQNLPKTIEINESRVYSNYGYAFDSKLAQLVKALPHLPGEFLTWCQEHSASPRDLFPLLSLQNLEDLREDLKTFASLAISRNLGAQILELLVECHLLSIKKENLTTATSGDAWLTQLKAQRYPQTLKNDSEKQNKMLSLPWPKDFQLRWQRQGDRSGLEVKFFVSHEKELPRFSQLLQQTFQLNEVNSNDTP